MIRCIFITYCYQRLKYTVANALLIVHKCWLIHNIILWTDFNAGFTYHRKRACITRENNAHWIDMKTNLSNLSNTFFNEVKWAQVNLHLTTVKVFKDSQLKIPQSDYINFNNYGEKTRQHSYQVWSCARARTEVNFRCVFVYRAVSGAGYKHS